MTSSYEILKTQGIGAFGVVMKAKSKQTGEIVAIKLIRSVQKDSYQVRKVIREILILRKMTEVENNQYVTGLIEVILPESYTTSLSLDDLNHLYIVMQY